MFDLARFSRRWGSFALPGSARARAAVRSTPLLALLGTLVPALAAAQTVTWGPEIPLSVPSAGVVEVLGLADFDDDGRDDVVVTDGTNLSILADHGAGFETIGTIELQGPGPFPIDPLGLPIGIELGADVGDLDGDGDLDLAIGSSAGIELIINDGSGGLTAGVLFDTIDDLGAAHLGDFDGDGNVDLARTSAMSGNFAPIIIGGDDTISIRFGDGLGGFGAANTIVVPGVFTMATIVLDVDENGRDDFVISGLGTLSFVRTNAAGGVLDVQTYPVGAGDAPQDFEVADFDLDGHLDLAFTCPVMGMVGVLRLPGTGTLGPFQDFVTAGQPLSIEAGDVDGDGDPDLLVSTSLGVELRLGDGAGGFSAAVSAPAPIVWPTLFVGNVTGNAAADLVLHDATTVQVIPNTTLLATELAFCRGDSNADGVVNLADGIRILRSLFVPGETPIECKDSADANDDGTLNVADGVHLLSYLFVDSAVGIAAPGVAACGVDPTTDALDCATDICP